MKTNILLYLILSFSLFGCKESGTKNEKLLTESKSRDTLTKADHFPDKQNGKILTAEQASKLADQQFQNYLPKILKDHEARLDGSDIHTGDFTGDGIPDVAIVFTLVPKDGGNAIVGQGISLYQNTGTAVKVIAGYEPDYLFSFEDISEGRIHVTKLEYADTDGHCCPSILIPHTLTISGSKVY